MMTLLGAGLVLGCGFGVAAGLGDFCLLRGLRQARDRHTDARALRAWALALAVAIAATQGLAWLQQIEPARAQVVRSGFALPAVLAGGALFGFGMVLARSCGARALVLLAGGNLRALVVLVSLGLAAQATLTGILAPLRQALQGFGQVQLAAATLPEQLLLAGVGTTPATLLAALPPIAALLWFALRHPGLRRAPREALAAALIGGLVALGWWISTHVEVDPFDPAAPTSLSFIGPVAESFLYLQLAVGRAPGLGPAIVLGTLAGAGGVALATKSFRLTGFDSPERLLASMAGGCLMGFGGVLAVGCSIGQGLSGLSTLALTSLPACLGIVLGCLVGLRAENSIHSLRGNTP